VKIVEVPEAVVHGIYLLPDASLRLDGGGAEITELYLNSEWSKASLEIRADSLEFGVDDSVVKHALCRSDGVFDIVDEVMFVKGHCFEALPDDHLNGVGVCVYHSQGRENAHGSFEVPLGASHVLEFESVFGLNSLIKLVQQDLPYYECEGFLWRCFSEGLGRSSSWARK